MRFYLSPLFAERLNVLYERNWTMLVHEQLRRFEGSIIKATKGGLTEAMGERLPRWTFTEALLYSITLITTIGNFHFFFLPFCISIQFVAVVVVEFNFSATLNRECIIFECNGIENRIYFIRRGHKGVAFRL